MRPAREAGPAALRFGGSETRRPQTQDQLQSRPRRVAARRANRSPRREPVRPPPGGTAPPASSGGGRRPFTVTGRASSASRGGRQAHGAARRGAAAPPRPAPRPARVPEPARGPVIFPSKAFLAVFCFLRLSRSSLCRPGRPRTPRCARLCLPRASLSTARPRSSFSFS